VLVDILLAAIVLLIAKVAGDDTGDSCAAIAKAKEINEIKEIE
jgi:hypothetical protein